MKKFAFILLLAALALTSCEQAAKLTQFDIPINETIDIPTLQTTFPDGKVYPMTLTPNIESELTSRGFSTDFLQQIVLKNLKIELTSPTGADLSFLKSVNVYISATGLSKELIASAATIPDNVGTSLTLTTNNINLKDYFLKDKLQLELNFATDKTTAETYSVKIDAIFMVDVKVLGL